MGLVVVTPLVKLCWAGINPRLTNLDSNTGRRFWKIPDDPLSNGTCYKMLNQRRRKIPRKRKRRRRKKRKRRTKRTQRTERRTKRMIRRRMIRKSRHAKPRLNKLTNIHEMNIERSDFIVKLA